MTESKKSMDEIQAEKARSLLKRFFVTDLLSPGMSLGTFLKVDRRSMHRFNGSNLTSETCTDLFFVSCFHVFHAVP